MKNINASSILLMLGSVCSTVLAQPVENHLDARAVLEHRSMTDPVAHGNYARAGDKVMKLHEVGEGLFQGIAPEKWDDKVHARDLTVKRDPAKEMSLNHELIARELFELNERDFSQTCSAGLACAAAWGTAVSTPLLTILSAFVDKLKEVKGQQVLDILKNEFFWANFLGVGGQNFIVTAVFRKLDGSGTTAPEGCSTNASQEDLMRALILQACSNNPTTGAFDMNMRMPDGSTFTLSMAAAPGNSFNDSQICHAPEDGQHL